MPAPDERYVNVLFRDEVIRAIEDFKFRERLPSRTEAIRVLIERGLNAGKPEKGKRG